VTSMLVCEFCSVFMEQISDFHIPILICVWVMLFPDLNSFLVYAHRFSALYSPARFSFLFGSEQCASLPGLSHPSPRFSFHLVSLFLHHEDLSLARSRLKFIVLAVGRAVVDSRPPGSVFTAGFCTPVACLQCSHLWVQFQSSTLPVCVSCPRMGFSSPYRFSHCFGLSSWFPRVDSLCSVFISVVAGVEHQGPQS
jgi:hypothetical protein